MNNRFVIVIIACLAVFAGLVFFVKKDASAPTSTEVTVSNHVQGEGTAGVTLIEYGDFQCPACGAYYPVLKQVKSQYGDKIKFQFRHFPIVSSHPNAMSAHRAAEAASLQDKFWEMHDMLYERQGTWKDSNNAATVFRGYAQELGLDIDRYNSDLVRAEIGTIIQQDITAGKDIGVNATPSFVLNGKLIESPRDLESFTKLIDDAIKAEQE